MTLDEIVAADHYEVTPCMVVGAGPVVARRFESLRSSVEHWLGESFPAAGVRWGRVDNATEVTRTWCQQILEPVLSAEFWFRMLEHGFIDNLPSAAALAPLRLCVIYDPGDGVIDHDLLERIARSFESIAAQRAELQKILLLLLPCDEAKGTPPPGCFDEIYVTTRVGRGGLGLGTEEIYGIARLTLHALIASEAGAMASAFLEQVKADRDLPLIGLGASAVTTAVAHMRDYRAGRFAHLLAEPYLGQPTETQQLNARAAGETWLEQAAGSWETTVRGVLARQGWDVGAASKDLASAVLMAGHPLARAIELLSPDLESALARHLMNLDKEMAEACAAERLVRQEHTLDQLADLAGTRGGAAGSDVYETGSDATGGQPGNATLALGLAWADGFISNYPAQPVLTPSTASNPAVFAADDAGWQAHARGFTDDCRRAQLPVDRYNRSSLTLGQSVYRIFLAWPVLAAFLQTFLQGPAWMPWVIAFAITSMCFVAAFVGNRRKAGRLQRAARERRHRRLRELALGITMRHVQQQHLVLRAVVSDAVQELNLFRDDILASLAQRNVAIEQVSRLAAQGMQLGAFFEHYLYDLPQCDEWVKDIVTALRTDPAAVATSSFGSAEMAAAEAQESSALQRADETVRGVARGQLPGRLAVRVFDQLAITLSNVEPNPRRLAAIHLSNSDPFLRGGKRWHWLFATANPMAGAGLGNPEATVVVLGDRSDLAGADGRASADWGKDWLEARSRQAHRITFLRIVPLTAKYLSGGTV